MNDDLRRFIYYLESFNSQRTSQTFRCQTGLKLKKRPGQKIAKALECRKQK
jgi:hypothetical protein